MSAARELTDVHLDCASSSGAEGSTGVVGSTAGAAACDGPCPASTDRSKGRPLRVPALVASSVAALSSRCAWANASAGSRRSEAVSRSPPAYTRRRRSPRVGSGAVPLSAVGSTSGLVPSPAKPRTS